jgi:hypothetical protein
MIQARELIAKGAQFLLAHRAEGGREKRQYHRMPALRAQRDGLTILIH